MGEKLLNCVIIMDKSERIVSREEKREMVMKNRNLYEKYSI